MISYHCGIEIKRGRSNDCAKGGSRSHSVVVYDPQESVSPEDSRQVKQKFELRGQISLSQPHAGLCLLHLLY